VDFYGNYSFHYLRQKRFHLWSYSHYPFYLLVGALSIKQDLQTRPRSAASIAERKRTETHPKVAISNNELTTKSGLSGLLPEYCHLQPENFWTGSTAERNLEESSEEANQP